MIFNNFIFIGPFYISRIYWADSEKVTFNDDNPSRENAFSDCARDYQCSTRIITNHMIKYAKDCNNDQIVDCLDYSAIHLNGFANCHVDLETMTHRRDFLERFKKCKLY